ncbi:alpha/beta fold hydrolase [Shewanella sp. AS1]|uniref:alpha/beta fold hydrolase n=1 Tax=Shewanella sp. AS1 TaxID=2907626 RepID=UPI001F2531D3|nr:alpha/beta fold hydrolase [Shewanella sp. AS1]MCE9678741.1 alpha/beta fold hydrolase [Shewanella sp. AS1]
MSLLNYQLSTPNCEAKTCVVLIHGLFGDLDNLKALANTLEEHQVLRLDVPNHGNSPHWAEMDYPSLAKAVVDLLGRLKIAQAHFVGHSMGGKIAMATALLYPQYVKSLVVADIAPVAYPPRHHIVFAALNQLDPAQLSNRAQALSQLLDAGIDEGTAQFLLKNLKREQTGFSWRMNIKALEASYDKLIGWELGGSGKSYGGPSLCIRGADSDYVQAAHTQAFVSQFPAIQAKSLAGAGHWLHAQKPAVFNRLVGEFIANHQ